MIPDKVYRPGASPAIRRLTQGRFLAGLPVYELHLDGRHLVIALRGAITRDAVEAACKAILAHPDYPHRNDIWVFGDLPILLNQGDLFRLVDLVAARYPAEATRERTAIVVRGGFATAVAEMWCSASERLPYQTQVFASLADAEAWVSDTSSCC